MKKFYGVVTPLSTPMCADENVDYDSLESLCHFLIEKGINGLYPNGTTGEVIYLTADERKKILEHVVKAAAGRAVVFSMVGAATTAETIELAQHAERRARTASVSSRRTTTSSATTSFSRIIKRSRSRSRPISQSIFTPSPSSRRTTFPSLSPSASQTSARTSSASSTAIPTCRGC